MKTQLLCILSLLFLLMGNLPSAHAQLLIVMEMIPLSDDPDRQAHVVTIPIADLNKVSRRWNDYVGNNAYGWESEKDGIHRQRGIIEKTISSNKFGVLNELVTTEDGVRLTVWFTQNGLPLAASKVGDKLDLAFKAYIQTFAMAEYRRAIQCQLKEVTNLKRRMKRKLAALDRKQNNPKRAINDSDYRMETLAMQVSIESNDRKMQSLTERLNAFP